MDESKRYARWDEVVVSNDKGRREVHYFLKDSFGNADLAVVGRERSLRHMTYETTDGFLRSRHVASPSPRRSPLANGSMPLKWKTRREVVDWLTSLVSGFTTFRSSPTDDKFSDYEDLDPMDGPSSKIIISSTITNQQQSKTFSWLGSSWTCRKRRKHYRSFSRRGITISVHDFVYIMAEENKRLVAYVDDLYEDMRENNLVTVRWFHKVDEVGSSIVLPPDVADREIFFSLCFQDLSVECIDGLACVFNPGHFDQFHAAVRPNHRLYPYMCRRLIDNDDIKAFDITQLQGYWSQEALRSILAPTSLKLRLKISTGKKRKRAAMGADEKNVPLGLVSGNGLLLPGQFVEVLSQDSGIRGCWFRCIILRKHQDRIKVQYLDIQDAEGTGQLEEWVQCSRAASLDDLGIRVGGRPTVRPAPSPERPILSSDSSIYVGSMVDARWLDGWWEGIVIRCESNEKIQVYFPGEKRESVFSLGQLRPSSEWVDGKWSPMKEREDIVTSILATIDNRQSGASSQEEMKSETLRETSSPTDDSAQEKCTTSSDDLRKDLMLDGLQWCSRKRRRFSPNRVKRSPGSSSGCTQEETEPSACGSFVLLDSSDHENCKIGRDPLFSAPTVAISNLVMSQ
ncbi:hypothetical protein LUZ62_025303 [Rhynchospora pubera]|uniref:BAH domain-containing protein n=1 Tax=Rhynchospora pubera TaxID=906938 RepID=A0AAV8H5D6_9POAL|nr:hypothetical protein LUZ62_070635 [Rhynchospora pubera]KAJ4812737.1 hypothetical protein LUZ62_025303 [Rhynchospora pubera]